MPDNCSVMLVLLCMVVVLVEGGSGGCTVLPDIAYLSLKTEKAEYEGVFSSSATDDMQVKVDFVFTDLSIYSATVNPSSSCTVDYFEHSTDYKLPLSGFPESQSSASVKMASLYFTETNDALSLSLPFKEIIVYMADTPVISTVDLDRDDANEYYVPIQYDNKGNPKAISGLNDSCFHIYPGSTSQWNDNSCTAFDGYYWDTTTNSIEQCSIGTHSRNGDQVCTDCLEGTFAPETGLSSCLNCITGKYQDIQAQGSCKECAIGYYGPTEGLTSCPECGAGKFSNDTFLTECFNCTRGYFQNMTAQSGCLPCAPGSYTAESSTETCTFCDVGKYTSSHSSTECSNCTPGYFQNLTAQVGCLPCAPGSYTAESSTETCTLCEVGKYTSSNNSTECSKCTPGYFQNLTAQVGCLACAPGSYTAESSTETCTLCESGKYTSSNSSTECDKCTRGYYLDTEGSQTVSDCKDCPLGTYGSEYGASMLSDCLNCPVGLYGDIPNSISVANCSSCPGGTYNNVTGVSTIDDCTVCPVGRASNMTGNDDLIDCGVCEPGSYQNVTGQTECVLCQLGTYTADSMTTDCHSCPVGKLGNMRGLVECSNCSIGYYQNETGTVSCEVCPLGTFGSTSGLSLCDDCSAGTFSNETQLDSCFSCAEGYYQNHTGQHECLACVPGTYTDTLQTHLCTSCERGKYTANFSSTHCFNCSLGFYLDVEGSDSSTDCRSCPQGTYGPSLGASFVSQCLGCHVGYYSDVLNLTSAADCSSCPAGTFNNMTGGSVLSDCTLCPVGTYSNETAQDSPSDCSECSPGFYQDGVGSTSCTECGFGNFSNTNGTVYCSMCPVGTEGNGLGLLECNNCSIGSYQNVSGSKECELCGLGTYGPSEQLEDCFQCLEGTFSNDTGLTECYDCAMGLHQDSKGQSGCMNCSVGTFSNATNSITCDLCPVGKYTDVEGSTTCFECPAGFYTNYTGGSSIDDCIGCPIGTFGLELGATNVSMCTDCPMGFYNDLVGQSNILNCTECPLGTYGVNIGAGSLLECTNCSSGKYNENPGSVSESNCSLCPVGTFNPYSGATSMSECLNCEAGYFTMENGTIECDPCAPGTYNDGSDNLCHNCSIGFWSDSVAANSSATCEQCYAGTFGEEEGLISSLNCTECPIGKWSNKLGQFSVDSCIDCSAGYYQNLTGQVSSSSCLLCGLAQFSYSGSHNCTGCPLGSYSTESGLTSPTQCIGCAALSGLENNLVRMVLPECEDPAGPVTISSLPRNATLYDISETGLIEAVIDTEFYSMDEYHTLGIFADPGFVGQVTFDSSLISGASGHIIEFEAVSDGTTVSDGVYIAHPSTPITIVLSDWVLTTDSISLDTLFYLEVGPTRGTLTQTDDSALDTQMQYVSADDGRITYTPGISSGINDTFSFGADDGYTRTPAGTITVFIVDEPEATAASVTVQEDGVRIITLEMNVFSEYSNYTLLSVHIDDVPSKGSLFQFEKYGDSTGSSLGLEVSQNEAVTDSMFRVVYVPNEDETGPDAFTFYVGYQSIESYSAPATINVTIDSIDDDPPVVSTSPGYVNGVEEVQFSISLEGTDPDLGDVLVGVITSLPKYGVLVNEEFGDIAEGVVLNSSTVFYTSDLDLFGTNVDSLEYKLRDSTGLESETRVIWISLANTEDKITATTVNVSAIEDTVVWIRLGMNAPDLDDTELSTYVNFTSFPIHGELFTTGEYPHSTGTLIDSSSPSMSAGDFRVAYKPDQDVCSPDEEVIWYTVIGSMGTSAPANVTISITCVNDYPEAVSNIVSIQEDTRTLITLVGTDPDMDSLSFTIESLPDKGTLYTQATGDAEIFVSEVLSNNEVYFLSKSNTYGDTSFEFSVSDGILSSQTNGSISITVTNALDTPEALPLSVDTLEDTELIISLGIADVEVTSGRWTAVITSLPTNGALYQSSGAGEAGEEITLVPTNVTDGFQSACPHRVVYIPYENSESNDAFKYTVFNEFGTYSDEELVGIEVVPVNDVPVVQPVSDEINEDEEVSFTLAGSDIEEDSLHFFVVSLPTQGTLYADGSTDPESSVPFRASTVKFSSAPDAFGLFSFSYIASDGNLNSSSELISITVNPVNDRPVPSSFEVHTDEDFGVLIQLVSSDADNDPWTAVIMKRPKNGILYQVDVAGNPTSAIESDNTTVTDGDGTTTFHRVYYSPTPDYSGLDEVLYTSFDSSKAYALTNGTISLVIENFNDAPVVTGVDQQCLEDGSVEFSPYGWISDDMYTTTITFAVVNPFPLGLLQSNCNGILATATPDTYYTSNCSLIYYPAADGFGDDYSNISLIAFDGEEYSAVETIYVSVTGVNDAPVAEPFTSVTTNEDTAVSIILEGTDVDSTKLYGYIYSVPVHGVLTDGSGDVYDVDIALPARTSATRRVYYTPPTNFFSGDIESFTYGIRDAAALDSVDRGVINITVLSVNDVPVGSDATISINEDALVQFDLEATDIETEFSDLVFTVIRIPSVGTLYQLSGEVIAYNNTQVQSLSTLKYLPPAHLYGSNLSSLTFIASDGQNSSSESTILFDVVAVNDVPVGVNTTLIVEEETKTELVVNDPIDVDSSEFNMYIVSLPSNGTLFTFSGVDLAPVGDYSSGLVMYYQPELNFVGSDSFSYRICDNYEGSLSQRCSVPYWCFITVDSTNDRPVTLDLDENVNEDGRLEFSLAVSDVDSDITAEDFRVYISTLPASGFLYSSSGNLFNSSTVDLPIEVSSTDLALIFEPYPGEFSSYDDNSIVYTSFMYYAHDGFNSSETGTVRFYVWDSADAPTLSDQTLTTPEDTSLVITVDPKDQDPMSILTVTLIEGALANKKFKIYQYSESDDQSTWIAVRRSGLTSNRFIFVPEDDVSGTFDLTLQVSDGTLSSQATISVEVTAVNDAPDAVEFVMEIEDNSAIEIEWANVFAPFITDRDEDDTDISMQIYTRPSRGTLHLGSASNPAISSYPTLPFKDDLFYLPDPTDSDKVGASNPYTSFTYRGYDSQAFSEAKTITVEVSCPESSGTFINIWDVGGVCMECPEGAICSESGSHVPANAAGYWGSDVVDWVFLPCVPAFSCPAASFVSTAANSSLTSVTTHICHEGYTGRLCGECSSDYYRYQNFCVSCDRSFSGSTYLALILFGIIFLSLIVIFYLAREHIDIGVFTITIGFFQTLSIISSFRQDEMDAATSSGAYSVLYDLLSLGCDTVELTYGETWIVIMSIPAGIVGFLLLLGLLNYGLYLLHKLWHWQFNTLNNLHPKRQSMLSFRYAIIKFIVIFMNLSYLSLIPKAFELFDCTAQQDGTYTLDAQPSLECFTSDWWIQLQVPAIMLLMLYGVGIPCFFLYILFVSRPPSIHTVESQWFSFVHMAKNPREERKHRDDVLLKNHMIRRQLHPEIPEEMPYYSEVYEADFAIWNAKYDKLTKAYDPITFYWELIVLVRKLLVSAIQIFLTSYPMSQATMSTLTLLTALFMQLWATPFISSNNNFLEAVTLVCSTLILVSTMLVYGDADFANTWVGRLLDTCTTILIYLSLLYIAYIVVRSILFQFQDAYPRIKRLLGIEWEGRQRLKTILTRRPRIDLHFINAEDVKDLIDDDDSEDSYY